MEPFFFKINQLILSNWSITFDLSLITLIDWSISTVWSILQDSEWPTWPIVFFWQVMSNEHIHLRFMYWSINISPYVCVYDTCMDLREDIRPCVPNLDQQKQKNQNRLSNCKTKSFLESTASKESKNDTFEVFGPPQQMNIHPTCSTWVLLAGCYSNMVSPTVGME
jgi:hypothetical protein